MKIKFTALLSLALAWGGLTAYAHVPENAPAVPIPDGLQINLPVAKKAPLYAPSTESLPNKSLTLKEAQAITYTWTDASGASHTSTLAETAKDPYQMVALLKEVYTNKSIPGPYYSAYNEAGEREDLVDYTGDIAGGWNIAAGDYTPNEEGYTVLLVAVKNSVNSYTDFGDVVSGYGSDKASYIYRTESQLVNFFDIAVDSIMLLTDGIRLGNKEDMSLGTIFNYNGSLNRFFFLGKGQARKKTDNLKARENRYNCLLGEWVPFKTMFEQFSPTTTDSGDETADYYNKLFNEKTAYPVIHDCGSVVLMEHYFSMTGKTGTDAVGLTNLQFYCPDYRLLYWTDTQETGGQTFTIDGRCIGAEYDVNGTSIIDKTGYWFPTAAKWANYNQKYAPLTLLYTITLEAEVTDVRDNDCTVKTSWESSLDQNIPGNEVDELYTLYIVTYDDNGNRVLTPIATGSAGEIQTTLQEYIYNVERKDESYEITYVVSGRPYNPNDPDDHYGYGEAWSNDATVIIPGKNENERLRIVFDHYESDYQLVGEYNDYRNYLSLESEEGNTITYADLLATGTTTIKLYRYDENGANRVLWATVTLTANNGTISYVVTPNSEVNKYNGQVEEAPLSGTITYTNATDPIDLKVLFADWFIDETDKNEQDYRFGYQAIIEAGGIVINGTATTADVTSNIYYVPVFKTNVALSGYYTQDEVDNIDKDRVLPVNVGNAMNVYTQLANRNEIWEYDVIRGINEAPTTQDQLMETYQRQTDGTYIREIAKGTAIEVEGANWYVSTVDKYDENFSTTENINSETGLSCYFDNRDVKPTQSVFYTPIITTFASGRLDGGLYNTYGCDIKCTGVGAVESSARVQRGGKGRNIEKDGVEYSRYKVALDVQGTLPNVYEVDPKEENCYEPYMYRVWVVGDNLFDAESTTAYGSNGAILLDERYTTNLTVSLGDYYFYSKAIGQFEDGKDYNFGKDDIDFNFVVRFYYKKKYMTISPVQHLINGRNATQVVDIEDPYMWYVVEKVADIKEASTGISEVSTSNVADVTYFNAQGMKSATPFDGVNIVVTRYTDGTTRTTKVIK